jgi:hypothetical protein
MGVIYRGSPPLRAPVYIGHFDRSKRGVYGVDKVYICLEKFLGNFLYKSEDDPLWEMRGHIVKKNSGKFYGIFLLSFYLLK